jgi:hypothetical protein
MDFCHTGALFGKLRAGFLEIAGWLNPLVLSGPSLFIWAGLMTMTLILYLGFMFLSVFDAGVSCPSCPEEPCFLSALGVLLLGGPYWTGKVFSILGISIMIYSAVYLNIKRKLGLVTTGPYRFVRKSQYFGAILYTINLTSRSYREVLGDVGWLSLAGTLLVWFAALLVTSCWRWWKRPAWREDSLMNSQHTSFIQGSSFLSW